MSAATPELPAAPSRRSSVFSRELVIQAIWDSFPKLNPRLQLKNPVMFIVELGSVITTVIFFKDLAQGHDSQLWFVGVIAIWLWLTVLFANFAEAIAEGRGKAQANALRAARTTTTALRRSRDGHLEEVAAPELQMGDVVVVEAGMVIPADGDIIEGVGSVDESAITGESAPVIREAGGDRSAVTGGTKLLSDRLVIEVTQEPGRSFLDRMIALVEGAERRKTPNEIALNILLAGLTITFLAAVVTLRPYALYAGTPTLGDRPHRAPRRADPDHDRCPPLGDRHRRDGPARAAERPGHVGSSRRGLGRRRRAPARQDRHHHARQPAGRPSSSRRPASTSVSWQRLRSWPHSPTRHPKDGRSSCSRRNASTCASASWESTSSSPSARPRA